MKKLIIALSLAASSSTFADCETNYELGKIIMDARQRGVTLTRSLEIVDDPTSREMTQLAKKIVIAAYKKPIHREDKMKEIEVNLFAADQYLDCREGK
jgi:hypothetical protein